MSDASGPSRAKRRRSASPRAHFALPSPPPNLPPSVPRHLPPDARNLKYFFELEIPPLRVLDSPYIVRFYNADPGAEELDFHEPTHQFPQHLWRTPQGYALVQVADGTWLVLHTVLDKHRQVLGPLWSTIGGHRGVIEFLKRKLHGLLYPRRQPAQLPALTAPVGGEIGFGGWDPNDKVLRWWPESVHVDQFPCFIQFSQLPQLSDRVLDVGRYRSWQLNQLSVSLYEQWVRARCRHDAIVEAAQREVARAELAGEVLEISEDEE